MVMTTRFKTYCWQQGWSHSERSFFWDAPTAEKIVGFIDKVYESGEFVDLYWDNMVKDNIKELDVYVEELEGNSIYEIDSVKDYHKLEEILSTIE